MMSKKKKIKELEQRIQELEQKSNKDLAIDYMTRQIDKCIKKRNVVRKIKFRLLQNRLIGIKGCLTPSILSVVENREVDKMNILLEIIELLKKEEYYDKVFLENIGEWKDEE